MNQSRTTIWGLYPGEHDGADGDFGNTSTLHANHVVGIGWPDTGSLAELALNQSELTDFYNRVEAVYGNQEYVLRMEPARQRKWLDRAARILRRFLCEAKADDLVVYACKTEECVYVAKIRRDADGIYKFDAAGNPNERIHWHYRHFRSVDWINRVSYNDCTQEELRQARTQSIFWRMKSCPEKFLIEI